MSGQWQGSKRAEGSSRQGASYDAFISYSHEDDRAAEQFQIALQGFARPWYRLRSFRVFRDTSNLAVEPDLRGAVQAALDQSRYLIVLASPASARSGWVDQELRHWLSSRPAQSVILVRLAGTIHWSAEKDDFDWDASDALPPALRGVYAQEPLFMDLGKSGGLSLRDAVFERAIAQVAARLRGVALDEMLGEHLRRRRQTRAMAAVIAFVVVSSVGAAGLAYRQSLAERHAKEQQAAAALSRRLAAQSGQALAQRDARLALLLGLASVRAADTREANNAILDALSATQHMVADIQVSDDAPVSAIALVAGSRLMITGGNRGSVAFWDLVSRERRGGHNQLHVDGVTGLAASPDGQFAASSGGLGGGLVIWDVARLEPVQAAKEARVFSVAFTRDGGRLLAADSDIWALDPRGKLSMARGRAAGRGATIVDIAAGGGYVATGTITGSVRILDRDTLRPIRTINPEPSTGTSVDISSDGRMLVMAGGPAARLWDLVDNQPYGGPYVNASGTVQNARFADHGSRHVALSTGADLYLWSGEPQRIGFHRDEIVSLAVDRDRGLLATGSRDGRARVWTLYPGNPFVTAFVPPEQKLGANAVALSLDGAKVAVGASDAAVGFGGRRSTRGVIYLVDAATGAPLDPPLTGHQGAIVALAFSSRGQLASASDDGSVRLWDWGERRSTIVAAGATGDRALDVAFSPDGRLLAFARAGRAAGIWDVERNAAAWSAETDEIVAVAFSPSGQLATGTAQGQIRLESIPGGRQRTLVPASSSPGRQVSGLAFDREGGHIVALIGSRPHIIEVETGSIARWQALGDTPVRAAATGGTSLAFLERSGRVSLWDLGSRQRIADLSRGLEAHFYPLPAKVAISSDGNRIAANVGEATLVFSVAKAAIESRACTVAGAPLSPTEWAGLVQTDYTDLCAGK